jgi:hypothetical protein
MPLKDGYEVNDEGGYDFKEWELFEFSSVPVPDNPEALTVLRSKGINVDAVLEKKDAPIDEPEPKEEAKKDEPIEVPAADTEEAKKVLDQANETITTGGELGGMIEPLTVGAVHIDFTIPRGAVIADGGYSAICHC